MTPGEPSRPDEAAAPGPSDSALGAGGRAKPEPDPPGEDDAARVSLPQAADVVFGSPSSPVAVCTLASRALLAALAGREEIAVAGRCHTENVGVERMVQNLVANPSLAYLLVCGRETSHAVGRTIVSLHRNGLDADHRVIGSDAPDPILPNLAPAELAAFRERVRVVDMIGETDAERVLATARALAAEAGAAAGGARIAPAAGPETIAATPDALDAWEYDPLGYFLIQIDRANRQLIAEHRDRGHVARHRIVGPSEQAVTQTIARLGLATVPAHLIYLGRELTKAELALRHNLRYEQDSPLSLDG